MLHFGHQTQPAQAEHPHCTASTRTPGATRSDHPAGVHSLNHSRHARHPRLNRRRRNRVHRAHGHPFLCFESIQQYLNKERCFWSLFRGACLGDRESRARGLRILKTLRSGGADLVPSIYFFFAVVRSVPPRSPEAVVCKTPLRAVVCARGTGAVVVAG